MLLEVKNISLAFGGLTVLNSISFSLEKAELFALIGPNGAGKTSVFNCISGIYTPSQGEVLLRGENIIGKSSFEIARLGLGRTFQHGEVFYEMTTRENMLTARHHKIRTSLFAEMLGLPSVKREEAAHIAKVDAIIHLLELDKYQDVAVGCLPFGIQKMIGVGRALAGEPSILLLDEPSAGLTREERETLAHFLLKIKAELGIGMIWIEHDMQMVSELADRIHVLDYGRSLAEGAPHDVLNHPEVIKAYLGEAHS
jgi:branched-chain amino acid transport system ATP-binding protein